MSMFSSLKSFLESGGPLEWVSPKLGRYVKHNFSESVVPDNKEEFAVSLVGGPYGLSQYKKSQAVGKAADAQTAYEKTALRRGALDRALGGNPLARQIQAPKPPDLSPYAVNDAVASMLATYYGGAAAGALVKKKNQSPKAAQPQTLDPYEPADGGAQYG